MKYTLWVRAKLDGVTESDLIWAALILAGAAFEGYALARGGKGDTLSSKTRSLFRVRTSRAGRYLFLAGWLGFTAWFAGHILDWWA